MKNASHASTLLSMRSWVTWSISSKVLSLSSTWPFCSVPPAGDLGRATFLSSTSTCNSINISRSVGRGADRFGSAAILVLMVEAFVLLDRVRDDTGAVFDRVRFDIAFGSGRLLFV